MKFETKFDINESAWYMKDNKPTKITVSGIEIVYKGDGSQAQINHNVTKYNIRDSREYHEKTYEHKLFKSKNKLLEFLFGDDSKVCKGKNCTAINGINHSPECIEEYNEVLDQVICPGTRDAISKLSVK